MKKIILFLCCLTIGIAGFAGQSQAIPVGLELLLLVDVSGSVDDTEYNLQKTGYVNAFNNAGIHAAIGGISGGIAVSYAEWSGSTSQATLVGWTQLTDAASSSAFAAAIAGTLRAFGGSTAPGSAINWGVGEFANNFEGTRTVIDVSGDGTLNSGPSASAARDAAAAAGFTINGLPIGSQSIVDFYTNDIKTADGFVIAAADFSSFEQAVLDKIGREIQQPPTGVAEPATLMLLGLGLLGLAGLRRRTK